MGLLILLLKEQCVYTSSMSLREGSSHLLTRVNVTWVTVIIEATVGVFASNLQFDSPGHSHWVAATNLKEGGYLY